MDKLVIEGGSSLNGTVKVSGAKNACLPILAATILADGEYNIKRVPDLRDISTTFKLLKDLNIDSVRDGSCVKLVCSTDMECYEARYDLVKTMRASILVLGPLLARRGRAKVSLPGGCAIGERPVDLHIKALELMGAKINLDHGYIDAVCPKLHGADINFDKVTVTGTENIMMAAVLAEGETILRNAAQEPEVVDLALFLKKMGAKIEGEGTPLIKIKGVSELNGADYSVVPDRIEAGTFICAVAGAGGKLRIENAPVAGMMSTIDKILETGLDIKIINENTIEVEKNGRLKAVDFSTQPYPGFATDMQAQLMACLTTAEGTSLVKENIFENRFMHVAELKRMGADIALSGRSATVRGVKNLTGAPVMASDLRASASLVIAGLMAEGVSEVLRIYHLDRGYESFEKKLAAVGANIKRAKDEQ